MYGDASGEWAWLNETFFKVLFWPANFTFSLPICSTSTQITWPPQRSSNWSLNKSGMSLKFRKQIVDLLESKVNIPYLCFLNATLDFFFSSSYHLTKLAHKITIDTTFFICYQNKIFYVTQCFLLINVFKISWSFLCKTKVPLLHLLV